MGYPLNDSERLEKAKTNIVNILKMEDYKLDSGELFQAFKEAGGEMSDFSPALEELSEENQIKTDSDGNIMTVQDYDRKKSQLNEEDRNEPKETTEEVMEAKESEGDGSEGNEDIESIIKLKEETDTWLIEQLKNKGDNGSERELRTEMAELRDRVQKLENVIKNLTKALE